MIAIAILFVLIGIVAGAVGSIVGLGGGIFFVPALLYFANQHEPGSISPQMAAGTSLIVIAVTALSSTLAYLKLKKVDKQSALLFFLGSAPGAIAGVYLNKLLQIDSFTLLFGLFQLAMFTLMMVKDKLKPHSFNWEIKRVYTDAQGVQYEYGYSRWVAAIVGFFIGVTSSLFGVGGGILMVPAMIVLFRFPPHIATATSMAVIFVSSIVGSVTNVLHDNISWLYAAVLAPGAWAGGKLGTFIASRLKGKTVVVLLRIVILGIALQMIGEAIFK